MDSTSQNSTPESFPSTGFAWRIVDDEALIINLETGHFYSLNQTATQVLIQDLAQTDLSELTLWFVQQSGRTLAAVQQDIEAFREQLRQAKIAGLHPAPTTLVDNFPKAEVYVAPALTVYEQIVGVAPYSPE